MFGKGKKVKHILGGGLLTGSLFVAALILLVGLSSCTNPGDSEPQDPPDTGAMKSSNYLEVTYRLEPSPESSREQTPELEYSFNLEDEDSMVLLRGDAADTFTCEIVEIKESSVLIYTSIPLESSDESDGSHITAQHFELFAGETLTLSSSILNEDITIGKASYDFYLIPAVEDPVADKPAIYLYPPITTDVEVRIDLDGSFSRTIPAYGSGWQVSASPDGRLVNKADGKEYPYLFWEGPTHFEVDLSTGFVVSGKDTEVFLREKLGILGLNEQEQVDFLEFWLPRMKDNPYNLIAFQGENYTNAAKLVIVPTPDSELRVMMVFKPLDSPQPIPEQQLEPFERHGFTVVEWGGVQL